MYKLLLCWRYLRTRYIALASIISVMLGVATMIVVNSVMSGFAHEMQSRIHGIISDIVFESRTIDGMADAEWHEEQIRQVAGDQIAAMSATVVMPAMLYSRSGAHPVQLFGIDEKTQSERGRFRPLLAASGKPQSDEFPVARRGLRRSRLPERPRRAGAEADGPGRLAVPSRGGADGEVSAAIRQAREARGAGGDDGARRRSLCRPSNAGKPLRRGKAAAHRRGGGHCHGQLSHVGGRRQVHGPARRRRHAHHRHGRPAAERIERPLYHRRSLREQDERIR